MSVGRRRIALPSGDATYREAGSGFPVVIVPGLGLTGRFYDRSYAVFAAAGLRLVVPDLPGTGGTPGPQTGLTPDAVAEFVIEFAAALRLPRALYVGHSLGGQSVLLLAMRAPALISGIALVGPTGGARRWPLLHQAKGLIAESTRAGVGVIGAVARDYLRVSPVRYIGTWMRHRDPVPDARLPGIDCPVLILYGSRDSVMNADYLELLTEDLQDVTAIEVPAGSHALPRSQHEAFNDEIVRFARRLSG